MKKRTKVTEWHKSAMRLFAGDGLTIALTAERVGLRRATVYAFARREGLTFTDGHKQRTPSPATLQRLEALRACAKEGLSQAKAARKLGINPKTVTGLARRYGITFASGQQQKHVMPVTVRGVTYANAHECAKALGVHPGTVYAAVCRNRLETLGTGRGVGKKHPHSGGRVKPCTIGGFSFPSLSAASLALGFKRKYLGEALRRNRDSAKQKVLAAAMQLRAKAENKAMQNMLRGNPT